MCCLQLCGRNPIRKRIFEASDKPSPSKSSLQGPSRSRQTRQQAIRSATGGLRKRGGWFLCSFSLFSALCAVRIVMACCLLFFTRPCIFLAIPGRAYQVYHRYLVLVCSMCRRRRMSRRHDTTYDTTAVDYTTSMGYERRIAPVMTVNFQL